MSWGWPALVHMTTNTTGTSALTLTSVSGRRTFQDQYGSVAVKVPYALRRETENIWEIGWGTFTPPQTLSRDTILGSSNSNNVVNLPAGTSDVYALDVGGTRVLELSTGVTINHVEWGATLVFVGSSAATITLPTQSLVPAGWFVRVRNNGTAILTLSAGAGTINGSATIALFPGDHAHVVRAPSQYVALVERNAILADMPLASQSQVEVMLYGARAVEFAFSVASINANGGVSVQPQAGASSVTFNWVWQNWTTTQTTQNNVDRAPLFAGTLRASWSFHASGTIFLPPQATTNVMAILMRSQGFTPSDTVFFEALSGVSSSFTASVDRLIFRPVTATQFSSGRLVVRRLLSA